jgi:hypothetical protein
MGSTIRLVPIIALVISTVRNFDPSARRAGVSLCLSFDDGNFQESEGLNSANALSNENHFTY